VLARLLRNVAPAAILASCYTTGAGPDPSPTGLYFPVGLAVSPGGGALFVANSDFDLQFNSGTLLTYDLPRLRETLRPLWSPESASPLGDPCIGLGANTNPVLQPGRCGPFDPNAPPDHSPSLVRGSAKIGAFATDLLFVCHPADGAPGGADCPRGSSADPRGARLFVPIRGEPSLTYFDVDDDRNHADGSPAEQTFRLDCGQVGNGRCSDGHRAGVDANDNTRGLTLPAEPFGIAVSQRADAIVVTHQSGGAVSLFTAHGPNGTSVLDVKPTLQFVFGSLPAAATGVAALPVPALVSGLGLAATNYQPGFIVTYRGRAQADVFRFFDDAFAAPSRAFLTRTSASSLTATPNGIDSRDIVIDTTHPGDTVTPTQRSTCEAACPNDPANPEFVSCLTACARIPLPAYIANRSPSSLIVGEVRTTDPTLSNDFLVTNDAVPLAQGPSRVVVGRIHDRRDPPGVYRTRIFVICFDARVIFVYDPVERRIDGQIPTGRGPHSLVMDPKEPIAYVSHFTDSYIGLIDLDQSHSETFESIVATIGIPTPPQVAK
jgi:DNA-binding beta-propeller fold protein YncE